MTFGQSKVSCVL